MKLMQMETAKAELEAQAKERELLRQLNEQVDADEAVMVHFGTPDWPAYNPTKEY